MHEVLAAALSDRYSFERELGRGGMATVYLARDVRHQRRVAIKVMHPHLATALDSGRFLREIEVAASLTHPLIVPLYDSGNAGGVLYYIMPYVEGESLYDRLQREKRLALEDALQITYDLADALGYAHRRGVLHRDVKPENILLAGGHALVADVAREIHGCHPATPELSFDRVPIPQGCGQHLVHRRIYVVGQPSPSFSTNAPYRRSERSGSAQGATFRNRRPGSRS